MCRSHSNEAQNARTPRISRRGFTLAEVVVAILIFGISATVLGRAVSDALRAYSMSHIESANAYVSQVVRKHVLTRSSRIQLEEGGELQIPVLRRSDPGTLEAETEMIDVRWEAEIHSTRLLDLFQVELTISLQNGGDAAEIEGSLIAYRPNWAESDETTRLVEMKEETFNERRALRGDNSGEEDPP